MRRITPQQQINLIARVRSGSYPHIAAESVGLPREVFSEWMEQGRKQRRGWRHQFWLAVSQAQAEVRAALEIEARNDAKFWLRFGPGKEGGTVLGWGPPAKRRSRKPHKHPHWQPELFQLLGEIAERLQPMPDARQVILDSIDRMPNR